MYKSNLRVPKKDRLGAPNGVVELLDVQQVSSLINASPRSIYRLVDACKMPRPVRLGALVRWRRLDLADWIDAGCPSIEEGGQR